jgi:hypothetical protein
MTAKWFRPIAGVIDKFSSRFFAASTIFFDFQQARSAPDIGVHLGHDQSRREVRGDDDN